MSKILRTVGVTLIYSIITGTVAHADSSSFSYELGLIVGSSELCAYKLNDDAVSEYVAANVPGSDVRFASNFSMHVGYHRSEAAKLTDLELRIHCEAAKRSAEHLKLIKP